MSEDAYVVEVPGGVLVVTGRGESFLPGEHLRGWFARLGPYLKGNRSLDKLMAELRPDRRAVVDTVLAKLAEAGAGRSVAGGATGSALSTFLSEITDDVPAALDRCRHAMVVVAGDGPAVGRLVAAVGHVVPDVVQVAGASVVELVAARGDGSRHAVVVQVAPADAEGFGELRGVCERAGVPLVQVAVDGDGIWWCPAGSDVGWADVRARKATWGSTNPRWPGEDGPCQVVATMIAHDILRFLVRDTDRSSCRVHAVVGDVTGHRTLEVRPHPYLRRVVAGDDEAFACCVARLAEARADATAFSVAAASLMDSTVGIFAELEMGPVRQFPLKVVTTTVADPVGLLDGAHARVVAVDPGLAGARIAAGTAALATYASLMVDPRLLVGRSADFDRLAGIDPWAALARLRQDTAEATARGLDLGTGRITRVPARSAFPALGGTDVAYRLPVGVGAGLTWGEAVENGLVRNLESFLETILRHREDRPHPRLVPPDTQEVQPLLQLFSATGAEVTFLDLTGIIDVPSVACLADGEVAGLGCGRSHAEAVRRALLAALRRFQLRERPPVCRPVVAAGAPRWLSTVSPRSVLDLVRAVQPVLGAPVAVPLDHDPEVAAVLPAIVQVVFA
ncbi:hypothetical protein DMP23_09520 [Amycolatopsis sp. A1MSW2902]|uniref:YcaO-like family protein n=1 Tax=Amycolatopsis sp. A1MSW2902 TaxID=687413 RepID=UPI00307F7004